jgi:hypothetical protein
VWADNVSGRSWTPAAPSRWTLRGPTTVGVLDTRVVANNPRGLGLGEP